MENNQTMKAGELRIGNLVIVDSLMVEIDNISNNGLNGNYWSNSHCGNYTGGFELDYNFDDNKIEGVSLDKEWFIKSGFKRKNGYGYFNLLLNGNIYQSVDGSYFIYQYYDIRIDLKYVHQLQNLYFALTNQELEIKES